MRPLDRVIETIAQLETQWRALTPFTWNGRRIGALTPPIAALCADAPDLFSVASDGSIVLRDTHAQAVGAALSQQLRAWFDRGAISVWRDEQMEVLDPTNSAPLFAIERGGRIPLGLAMRGVHLNVWTRREGRPCLWIAQRAASKAVAPLMWDNCADGGVASGESEREALVREAHEEAGIPPQTTYGATFCGRYAMMYPHYAFRFIEHASVFSLEVPASFSPTNLDGEVAQFACIEVHEVRELLSQGSIPSDVAVTLLDWLVRFANLNDAAVDQLLAHCRRGLNQAP